MYNTHTYTCAHTFTHIFTHIRTYTHIHTHAHPCTYSDAINCNGHGEAQNNGNCACFYPRTGQACEYSSNSTCKGHGQPEADGSCNCYAGYEGKDCATELSAEKLENSEGGSSALGGDNGGAGT